MEIEVGKRYVTRDGRRVYINEKRDNSAYPFRGTLEGRGDLCAFTSCGAYTLTDKHPLDIVAKATSEQYDAGGDERVAISDKEASLKPPSNPQKVYEGVCIDGPLDGCKYAHRSTTMKCEKFVSYSINAGPGYTRSVPHEPIEYHFFTIHDGPHKAHGVWTTHAHDTRIGFHVYHAIMDRFSEKEDDGDGK